MRGCACARHKRYPQRASVSRRKMSNESTVRQAASTAPRCRDQSEARTLATAHAGRAHGWTNRRPDGILVVVPLPPLLFLFLRMIMFVTSLSAWDEEGSSVMVVMVPHEGAID